MGETVKFIGGIVASGTFAAIVVAIANRMKVRADSDSTFADTYLKVSDKLNKDIDRITTQFEEKIRDLVTGYEIKLKEKDVVIQQQQHLIQEQQTIIDNQKDLINSLGDQIPRAVEEARGVLHKTVDKLADKLNPEIES